MLDHCPLIPSQTPKVPRPKHRWQRNLKTHFLLKEEKNATKHKSANFLRHFYTSYCTTIFDYNSYPNIFLIHRSLFKKRTFVIQSPTIMQYLLDFIKSINLDFTTHTFDLEKNILYGEFVESFNNASASSWHIKNMRSQKRFSYCDFFLLPNLTHQGSVIHLLQLEHRLVAWL